MEGLVGQSISNLPCGNVVSWICTNLPISSSKFTIKQITPLPYCGPGFVLVNTGVFLPSSVAPELNV